jgi:hypothetical protein
MDHLYLHKYPQQQDQCQKATKLVIWHGSYTLAHVHVVTHNFHTKKNLKFMWHQNRSMYNHAHFHVELEAKIYV